MFGLQSGEADVRWGDLRGRKWIWDGSLAALLFCSLRVVLGNCYCTPWGRLNTHLSLNIKKEIMNNALDRALPPSVVLSLPRCIRSRFLRDKTPGTNPESTSPHAGSIPSPALLPKSGPRVLAPLHRYRTKFGAFHVSPPGESSPLGISPSQIPSLQQTSPRGSMENL